MPSLKWPSVEEQIAAHKVRTGSALEQLIRAHQDFGVLRPEEATDELGYPPWLRVYWRKRHPEARYPAGDPTGGYPLSMGNVLEMMLADQDRPEWSEAAKAVSSEPAPQKPPSRRTPRSTDRRGR
jgi:hypothetical protein